MCFVHVPRTFGLAKTILQGTVRGKRRKRRQKKIAVVVIDLLFNVHGKHLRSCRDGQLI